MQAPARPAPTTPAASFTSFKIRMQQASAQAVPSLFQNSPPVFKACTYWANLKTPALLNVLGLNPQPHRSMHKLCKSHVQACPQRLATNGEKPIRKLQTLPAAARPFFVPRPRAEPCDLSAHTRSYFSRAHTSDAFLSRTSLPSTIELCCSRLPGPLLFSWSNNESVFCFPSNFFFPSLTNYHNRVCMRGV